VAGETGAVVERSRDSIRLSRRNGAAGRDSSARVLATAYTKPGVRAILCADVLARETFPLDCKGTGAHFVAFREGET